jgi:hypothetical protein
MSAKCQKRTLETIERPVRQVELSAAAISPSHNFADCFRGLRGDFLSSASHVSPCSLLGIVILYLDVLGAGSVNPDQLFVVAPNENNEKSPQSYCVMCQWTQRL